MDINELLINALRGDAGAETQLFEALTARFRLFAHQRLRDGCDCEEVVQESLLTIAREYKTTEFTTSFAAWAYKVLDYRILAQIKKRRTIADREQPLPDEDWSPGAGIEDVNPDLKRKLLDCLRQIRRGNPRYARALALQYQGYETEEQCQRMRLTRNTFYSLLSRARSALERCLEQGGML
ncbi:MAG TPA: RNA polymerase sigma factor [candidate division Zixibacteria bacterium]|mgnify:CR=1 FL=1|nr:RNA polymerase sigma factor [candidate division Zixibacteria bacterium]